MKPFGVFYATREGHTGRIAAYVAERLENRGFHVQIRNLRVHPDLKIGDYEGVILASPVHAGKHEPSMAKFVKKHRDELERVPAAFLSVTLSEAGAERTSATPEEHARFTADVQKMLDIFQKQTGWKPKHVKPVAGALLYTKYNFLIRFIMKWIARKAGAATDTSRDYEYTDWAALDRFIDEFVDEAAWRSMEFCAEAR
jgi:menaquinone-dependent protoporphyrinogen oxidase